MVPFDPVVLTDEEQQDCQAMLRSLTQTEGDGSWYIKQELHDSFNRSVIALCMMGRAERFLILSGSNPEYREQACQAAAKACAIFPLSIYFYDFGRILQRVGKIDEARQMFTEFLTRNGTEVVDPIMQVILKKRDAAGAAEQAIMFLKEENNAFDDEQKSAFVTLISEMLEIQLSAIELLADKQMVTGKPSIEDSRGRINRKAIGYIYGFIDCALQCAGQNMSDVSIGVPITYQVLRHLFPGREDAYIKFIFDHLKDERMALGMMKGGQQYADYSKPDRPGAPMGLTRFILEGDN
jgi:hypothetical protein